MKEKKYYVYVYLDPRNRGRFIFGTYCFEYEPFYIGKGTKDRCYKHLCETSGTTSNLLKYRVIRNIYKEDIEPIIVKVHENLEENEAYELETNLIKLIGRRCDNSGSLTNILIDIKPPNNYIKLDQEIINQIIKYYNDGYYIKHIGIKLGLNENKVKKTLIENGIKPKRKPPTNIINLDKGIVIKMIDEYNSGKSIRKICEQFNLSFEVVRKNLKINGIQLRGYDYKKTKEHIAKIWANRERKNGENHPCYKELTKDEINKLKQLRFEERKTIKEILNEMQIGQELYYRYINV